MNLPGGGWRRVDRIGALIAALALGWALAVGYTALSRPAQAARQARSADLVAAIGLTDLALFTEARFARHPAMADLHTAFQDSPMSFDHFPSASFAPRPAAGFGAGALTVGRAP